jgi:hypothetical protein
MIDGVLFVQQQAAPKSRSFTYQKGEDAKISFESVLGKL